ncbi:MAG: zinc ribbon domain-containing protein [Ruminococcaceae bacterium]|nr:zinc ribbon domain-containing protein [Oscillospiraceae bacterium]
MKCKYCGFELKAEDLFCTNCGHQADDDVPKKIKRSASKIWTIILSAICAVSIVVIVILGINLNEESESSDRYYRLWRDAKQSLEKAQEDSVITFLDSDIAVKITGFYNQSKTGSILDYTLNSNNMRYLSVHYEVKWLVEKPDSKLYISIYAPDGTLRYNSSSSPSGYTMEASLSEGANDSGWGNSTTSTYTSGYYTFLFTYENKIIAADQVYIK